MVRTRRQEIIRCPCFQQNTTELMIQCEECFVWQHYDCIGIKKEPKYYFCEECRPDGHPFWLKLDEQVVQEKKVFEIHTQKEMIRRLQVMELYFQLNDLNTRKNDIEWELEEKELSGSDKDLESMVYSAIQRFRSRLK